jgi:transcriptional regulator with XRE-family HTH domain
LVSIEEGLMLTLTAGQKKYIANVIMTKRKEMFNYPGGNSALAARVGVSSPLLSMWAYNKRTPNHTQLLVLAEIFNMSLDDLCRLKPKGKRLAKHTRKAGASAIPPEKVRGSMLRICDITGELVERERKMLRGKINYKDHKNWQKRIKGYVDTL